MFSSSNNIVFGSNLGISPQNMNPDLGQLRLLSTSFIIPIPWIVNCTPDIWYQKAKNNLPQNIIIIITQARVHNKDSLGIT